MPEKIVIIGSGWAGYTLAHAIDDKKFDVVVIAPEATSPHTPLLASAARGLFNFSLAEEPIRRKKRAIRYLQAECLDIDFEAKSCHCRPAFEALADRTFNVTYDRIFIAPGCQTNTFGTPGVAEHAFFVKNVKDAVALRQRPLDLFEMASLPIMSEAEQRRLLHIVVVGGGPTGVEVSAELSDLVRNDLVYLYPSLAGKVTMSLHDVAANILSVFDKKLSEYALASFKKRTVEIKTGSHITKVEAQALYTKEDGEIPYGMLIWATGNKQVPLVDTLKLAKSERLSRIWTDGHLHPKHLDGTVVLDAFAIGDASDVENGELPTTAEVACQKADYVARVLNYGYQAPFTYQQRALVAYLGQHDGVVTGRQDWSGPAAWLAWRSKNLTWARSWRNKILITVNWTLNYIFGKEIARA